MPPSPDPLNLQFLHKWSQVEADCRELEARGHCSAFQTIAWLRPFYGQLAPALGLEPLFLRVSHRDASQPLMLWPLVRDRRLGLSMLSFADAGISDYNAPLVVREGLPPATWSRALQALRRQGHVLRLDKLQTRLGGPPSPLLAAMGTAAAELSFGSWAVDLPRTFEDYERVALSAAFTKDLAMRWRRLQRKGNVRFELARTPDARRRAFEALVRQRARRFAETGRDDILGRAEFRRCYEMAAVEEPGETVRLFTLAVDETVVAVMLAIDHEGTRHMVMPSFEAGEWKNCSPGNLLISMSIRDAIEAGLSRYDFTIGDETYKAGFGATRQPMHGGLLPLSFTGACAVHGVRLARALRQRLARSRPAPSPQPTA